MAELKFPTLEELGRQGGEWALNEFEYKGLTIRQWADKITTGEYQPVKHGHWIDTPLDRYKKFESKCSECGWHGISNYDSYVDIYEFEYCPNCGAKMDGGADE